MSYEKNDLIKYRLEKAHVTLTEAKSLFAQGYYSGAANRLYYSCFYAVIALLAKDDISVRTHNGVRSEFFRLYIKTGILNSGLSETYSNLMGIRQDSDYGDLIDFQDEDIRPLVTQAEEFIKNIEGLLIK